LLVICSICPRFWAGHICLGCCCTLTLLLQPTQKQG